MDLRLKTFLIPPYPLTNFEIQKYYQNEHRFNEVYSRDNSPKRIKHRPYLINLDEYANVGTHWIALYVEDKEIEKFIRHKNIKIKIFRIQANNSVMCEYFCIGFIDFMFVGKTLIDFTSLFSTYDFEKMSI